MKHVLLIILVIIFCILAILLPYLPGDYDFFATGISMSVQFASFISLLLVPVGLYTVSTIMFSKENINQNNTHPRYTRTISLFIGAIIVMTAALGAFASHNRFAAIIILVAGIFLLFRVRKKSREHPITSRQLQISSYYFIVIPIAVLLIRLSVMEKVKDNSTDHVINQSGALISDIESYKISNGYYPLSILSTIEDYHTDISGIPRFFYERSGDAYNLYFQQFSETLGTEEFVMYNKLDEQEMTVHNQDLLRITASSIIRGYHQVVKLKQPHWKVFYFD